MNKLIRNRLSQTKESHMLQHLCVKKSLLEKLEIGEADIFDSTCDVLSLQETEERQGIRRGLLNVTDAMYKFSLNMFNKSSKFVSERTLGDHSEDFFDEVLRNVQDDGDLLQEWFDLFGQAQSSILSDLHECMIMDLFDSITRYFVKIEVSDFIKQYRTNKRNNASALRTNLKQKEGKGWKKVSKEPVKRG